MVNGKGNWDSNWDGNWSILIQIQIAATRICETAKMEVSQRMEYPKYNPIAPQFRSVIFLQNGIASFGMPIGKSGRKLDVGLWRAGKGVSFENPSPGLLASFIPSIRFDSFDSIDSLMLEPSSHQNSLVYGTVSQSCAVRRPNTQKQVALQTTTIAFLLTTRTSLLLLLL
jgi:hypothetical protein